MRAAVVAITQIAAAQDGKTLQLHAGIAATYSNTATDATTRENHNA